MALWLCGSLALWIYTSVALWLCGSVALWLCGSVALDSVALWPWTLANGNVTLSVSVSVALKSGEWQQQSSDLNGLAVAMAGTGRSNRRAAGRRSVALSSRGSPSTITTPTSPKRCAHSTNAQPSDIRPHKTESRQMMRDPSSSSRLAYMCWE